MVACLMKHGTVIERCCRSYQLGVVFVLITSELLGEALAREGTKTGEKETISKIRDSFTVGTQHIASLDDVFRQCQGSYDPGIYCCQDNREDWFCFGDKGRNEWFPVALRCHHDIKRYTVCLSSSLRPGPFYCYSIDGRPYVDVFSIGRIGLLLFASIAVRSSGLIIHGALLQDKLGRGMIICGPSGSGKTTIAFKLAAQGYRVIHDDRVVLFSLDHDKYVAFPLYWNVRSNGAFSEGVPIERLFFLDRKGGSESHMDRVPQHIAYHQAACGVFYYRTLCRWDSQTAKILTHCVAHVPAYQIYHALKDPIIGERIGQCFQ